MLFIKICVTRKNHLSRGSSFFFPPKPLKYFILTIRYSSSVKGNAFSFNSSENYSTQRRVKKRNDETVFVAQSRESEFAHAGEDIPQEFHLFFSSFQGAPRGSLTIETRHKICAMQRQDGDGSGGSVHLDVHRDEQRILINTRDNKISCASTKRMGDRMRT